MHKSTAKLIGLFAGFSLLLVVAVSFSFVVYGVYYRIGDSGFTRAVAHAAHLPAARVGSITVSYDDFLTTRDAVRQFLSGEAGQAIGSSLPPENEINKNILEQLIRQAMVTEITAERNLSVSDDDVRAIFADVVKAAASSTTPDVATYLWENYGWHEENFREKVLRPALLEQKAYVALAQEAQGDETALENSLAKRRQNPDVVVYLQF